MRPGLGHRPTLCGHVLTALNTPLPRLEDALIREGLRGATIAAIAYGQTNGQESEAEREWADRLGLTDPLGGTVLGDKLMARPECREDHDGEQTTVVGPCDGGQIVVAAEGGCFPVVYDDDEETTLRPREAAIVPATAVGATGGTARRGATPA